MVSQLLLENRNRPRREVAPSGVEARDGKLKNNSCCPVFYPITTSGNEGIFLVMVSIVSVLHLVALPGMVFVEAFPVNVRAISVSTTYAIGLAIVVFIFVVGLGITRIRAAESDVSSQSVPLGADPRGVFEDSGFRLPLPQRDTLDDDGKRLYDIVTARTIAGLRGPAGISLYSPKVARSPLEHCISRARLISAEG